MRPRRTSSCPAWTRRRRCPGALPPAGRLRAIVADNGSTDGSPRVAGEHGATVVHVLQRCFGAAAHAGLEAATSDVVCFCDADGSMDAAQLPRVAEPVVSGECELMLGRRRPTVRAAWPTHARAANAALGVMLRRRTGLRLHDLGPMRVGRRKRCSFSGSPIAASATRWRW